MKDRQPRDVVKPKDFCKNFPPLLDRGHIKGHMALTDVFNMTSFRNKIVDKLSADEIKYIESLITKTGKKFNTVSDLRTAFNSGNPVLDPKDSDTQYNEEILKRIFYYNTVLIW